MNTISQVSHLQAKVVPSPVPATGCFTSWADLIAWLRSFTIDVAFGKLFGYTAGKREDVTRDMQGLPRFMFDAANRYLGVAVWVPELGSWSIGGIIGELKTVVRTAGTVADDMAEKMLAGWAVCDGSTQGVPDLTADLEGTESSLVDPDNAVADTVKSKGKVKSPWFKGSSTAWEIYTVMYTGVLPSS